MTTVQVTREQPREERSQRIMTILLWAWRVENSTKEPPSLYVPRHSGLFFWHITHCLFRKLDSHCMFGSFTATACLEARSIFWERMTWSEGRACTCTLHCIFWLNPLPGNLNCSFPSLYWEASFWYCAMLWVNLCPGNLKCSFPEALFLVLWVGSIQN